LNYEPILYNTIAGFAREQRISFHMPVHGGGMLFDPQVREMFLQLDLTELDATDNLAHPTGPIAQTHQNMARLFGADNAHLLVGGSSAGLHAMLLACLRRGDTVLVDRCVHQSVLNACTLYGFQPVFFERTLLDGFSIPGEVELSSLRRAAEENPHAKAVLITTPTYYGICSDVAAIADIAHRHNMALLADCAHGPHFTFCDKLPNIPTEDGADLCVLSLHKTLGAPTQTALLLHKTERVSFPRVKACINMVHTTSPSYLLLCAADLVCAKMAAEGDALFSRAVKLTKFIKDVLEQDTNLRCLPDGGDLTRLVVNVSAYALSGYAAADMLDKKYGIDVEMADLYNIVCIIGPLTTQADADALVCALRCVVAEADPARGTQPVLPPLPQIWMVQDMNAAFFSDTVCIPLSDSIGRVSAATVSVYPPGIPCFVPGAQITSEALCYLEAVRTAGGAVTGLEGESIVVKK
jgi:arginine decarboxylase